MVRQTKTNTALGFMSYYDMTSLEPLRNSQRDFSLGVTLKFIMLQSRGLRANARGVNEVMLRRIANCCHQKFSGIQFVNSAGHV